MRIYKNCNEAIVDIGRELKKNANSVHTQTYQNKVIADNPDFETKEIEAFEFAIVNTDDMDTMPNVTPEWCREELKERVGDVPLNPGFSYKLRPEVWNEFLNEHNQFDYTYSERMYWQIKPTIEELVKNPETRQAIIQMHDRNIDQDNMANRRVPCSMFYHFMKRDGKLDVIYVMRSTDFVTHFQNDIWLAIALRDHIAKKAGIEPGKFIMFASSLHIYKKDWDELKNY